MKLYIIRHAQADPVLKTSDFERKLTQKGKEEAQVMASALSTLLPVANSNTLILSSTAQRTIETSLYFAQAIDYPLANIQTQASLYEATYIEILQIINNLDSKYDTVLLIGHNPGLSNLAQYISGNWNINMQTASIVSTTLEEGFTWAMLSANTANFNNYFSPADFHKDY